MEENEKNPRKKPAKKRVRKKRAPKKDKVDDVYDTSFGSLSTLSSLFQACESPTMLSRRRSVKAMGNNLQEHLSSFILIGYTVDGEPVQMTFAPTPRDMDSLNTGLHKFIMSSGGF